MNQTIAQSGEISGYSEYSIENESLIWAELLGVFIIVLWIAIGFLELILANKDAYVVVSYLKEFLSWLSVVVIAAIDSAGNSCCGADY